MPFVAPTGAGAKAVPADLNRFVFKRRTAEGHGHCVKRDNQV